MLQADICVVSTVQFDAGRAYTLILMPLWHLLRHVSPNFKQCSIQLRAVDMNSFEA